MRAGSIFFLISENFQNCFIIEGKETFSGFIFQVNFLGYKKINFNKT